MLPPPVQPQPLQRPVAAPMPLLSGGVHPRAATSANHITGEVDGTRVLYGDLSAFAWFAGGGWDYRNGRRLRRRGLSGGGDTDEQGRR